VLGLDRRGRIWAWGCNESGCLGVGDNIPRLAPVPITNSDSMEIEDIVCGVSHSLFLSKFSASEVQSRKFYQEGLMHHDDVVEDGFCLYNYGVSSRYFPLSLAENFASKHGVPISADFITVANPQLDRRLSEVLDRMQELALQASSPLERVRVLALSAYYELGGAQVALNEVSKRHITQLMERKQDSTGLVPLGSIRLGDSRHRSLLFKLACDRMGIPCALLRGSLPASRPYQLLHPC